MTPVSLGKLSFEAFERIIAPHLGAARAEVITGPRIGTDTGIVKLGAGRVMAITADPLSLVPGIGLAASARMACHLLASDLWTSGIPPAYAAITFNLPPDLSDADLAEYWRAMSDEWKKLEVAVVTGHTGRYPGCGLSIVGACTLIGVGDEGRTVGPGFVAPGDRVIVTKDAALEVTAIAGTAFPRRLARELEPDGVERARRKLEQVSVVKDCRAALRVGVRDRGVSALHDATEGGVLGGLIELARASGHDLRIERARIPVSAEARAACRMFDIDPYWSLSEGTLIVAARPAHANAVITALEEEEIAAADVGEVVPGHGMMWLTEPDGVIQKLVEPLPDPYWDAYRRAVAEGWD